VPAGSRSPGPEGEPAAPTRVPLHCVVAHQELAFRKIEKLAPWQALNAEVAMLTALDKSIESEPSTEPALAGTVHPEPPLVAVVNERADTSHPEWAASTLNPELP
jgi:hypothetical protein